LKIHNVNSKEYYDKFIKKENEGYCLECGMGIKTKRRISQYMGLWTL